MERGSISFFNKLFYSIAKFDKYPSMLKEGAGKAFIYLLLFTLLFGSVSSIRVGYQVVDGISSFSDEIKRDVPDFSFSNGELQVEGEMPIVIDETSDNLVMIDVTNNTSIGVLEPYETGFIFLKDRLIVKTNRYDTRELVYADFDLYLTKEGTVEFLSNLKWVGFVVGFIAIVVFLIGKLISSLIMTLLGLIIMSVQKVKLSFGQLYSLGIYTLTLPIIVDLFLSFFHIDLPFYVYYGIALVYVWFAIKSFKGTDDLIED